MSGRHSLYGPLDDVAADAGYAPDHPKRVGFFTDTSVCIGCKACEVACKEWNLLPDDGFDLLGMSMDNTGSLGSSSWRHVAFIEQQRPVSPAAAALTAEATAAASTVTAQAATAASTPAAAVELGMPSFSLPGRELSDDGERPAGEATDFRWLMASDVCKHCTHAACLDVCPTGALFRTEFGTVVVQSDICNGCGYCVSACPYGVIERRESDGRAWKCTMCYDRIGDGLQPACATACPTQSIQFGELDELRERAQERVEVLHSRGVTEARLYGESPDDGVGGDGAFFLLLDEPEVYGLPPDPVVTTRDLPQIYGFALAAAGAMLAAAVSVFAGGRRR